MAEDTYIIRGIIKAEESLTGIEDLLVVALDIDLDEYSNSEQGADIDYILQYDRLGSVLTGQDGRFELTFNEADFRVVDTEPRPDILLAVFAPEVTIDKPQVTIDKPLDPPMGHPLSLGQNIIHVSPPIRLKAGRHEAYSIRVTSSVMARYRLDAAPLKKTADPDRIGAALQARTDITRRLIDHKLRNFDLLVDASSNLKAKASDVFANFSLSKVTPVIRAKDTFLGQGDDLNLQQHSIVERGLNPEISDTARPGYAALSGQKQMKISLDRQQLLRLGALDGDHLQPEIDISDLWSWWSRHNDTILERRRSVYQKCIKPFREEHELPDSETTDEPTPSEPTTTDPVEPGLSLEAEVRKLVECATCPEEPLTYAKVIDSDYKDRDIRNTINGLELTSGPTDVTAYHDFNRVELAFESIWTEAFDDDIAELGKEIFAEIVKTAEDECTETLIRTGALAPRDVSGLKSMMREYRRLTGTRRNRRLDRLFDDLEKRLAEPHRFDVFAADSFNFGVMYTFRQKWEPGPYQVGRLVKTIPMAPKEERKYTTKVTKKVSRALKEIEDREFKGSSESSSTSRAESEIVSRATNKNSFSTNAQAQYGIEGMFDMQMGMNTGMEAEKFSSETKKNFRESVLKAAQEYRKQTKTEVTTSTEETFENTTSGTLVNPNDEISVTYLFYELQRQFHISESLHRVAPVIAVAFEVPKPSDIDDDWLMTYAWILRRSLLDDSYHVALDFLTESSVGSEVALQTLGSTLERQQKLVDELNKKYEIQNRNTEAIMNEIVSLMTGDKVVKTVKEVGDFVHGLLNPLAGLFGGVGGDSGPDIGKFKEVLELQLERSEKQQQMLASRLKEAQGDLQGITDKFGKATREHFNKQTAITQLRIHIKENILYYMQAIWDYEQPDQRFFRLYDLEIDWFEPPEGTLPSSDLTPRINLDTGEIESAEGTWRLPMRDVRRSKRKLVDVADLDNLIGFKGNYALFAAKEPNYLHLHMMQDFIDTQVGGVRDPDTFADLDTQDLIDYLKCVRINDPDVYAAERDQIIDLINERQRSPRREKELVVVPSDSLYLECLPGKHPVLEDFKLVHRAIDVKKVQAEVRAQELENLRYAARLLQGERDDPNIEKQIHISGPLDDVDVDTGA